MECARNWVLMPKKLSLNSWSFIYICVCVDSFQCEWLFVEICMFFLRFMCATMGLLNEICHHEGAISNKRNCRWFRLHSTIYRHKEVDICRKKLCSNLSFKERPTIFSSHFSLKPTTLLATRSIIRLTELFKGRKDYFFMKGWSVLVYPWLYAIYTLFMSECFSWSTKNNQQQS